MLWVIAFLGTLFTGVLRLNSAVGMSLIVVLYESVRPQISVLEVPGTAISERQAGRVPRPVRQGRARRRVGPRCTLPMLRTSRTRSLSCVDKWRTQSTWSSNDSVTSVGSTTCMLEDLFAERRKA